MEKERSDEPRGRPYLWATWLADALDGDHHCEWSFWYRAHYKFTKLVETTERQANLASWSSDHERAVSQRVDQLLAMNYEVRVEHQNKFTINGRHAIVGGAADIVALSRREASVTVEDIKTGQPKQRDYWQVLTYLIMLPMAFKELSQRLLFGSVIYPRTGSVRDVTLETTQRSQVIDRITEIALLPEPRRTPSGKECKFCPIALCPDRVRDDDAVSAETEEF